MSTRTKHSLTPLIGALCMILGGCADCGRSDAQKATTESQGTPVNSPSTNARKFPMERHPLAPFIIDAGK
jgi:hypothetical protein